MDSSPTPGEPKKKLKLATSLEVQTGEQTNCGRRLQNNKDGVF
uniref:Uncharacterized protein n=1 Tax=Arundo donax TaxID=35708 RepID=A0A0A9FQN0_ARUDO